jgi:hypothetical protein
MLTSVALHAHSLMHCLPLSSIVEEYKCAKVRLAMMLRNSPDCVISSDPPRLRSGRKWQVESAVDDAVAEAQFAEVLGAVQMGRAGVGFGTPHRWWSKENASGRRQLVVGVVRRDEERQRCAKAMQQPVQGAWTTWEGVRPRSLTWQQIWEMPESALRFLVQSTYDVIPTPLSI